jgi:hypothetical protein
MNRLLHDPWAVTSLFLYILGVIRTATLMHKLTLSKEFQAHDAMQMLPGADRWASMIVVLFSIFWPVSAAIVLFTREAKTAP